MPVVLTLDTLKLIKLAAKDLTQGIGSSHLSEAMAVGFGFKTNASLRSAVEHRPALAEVSDAAFNGRLAILGDYRHRADVLSAAVHEATMRRIRSAAELFPRMTLSGLNPVIGSFNVHKTRGDWDSAREEFLGSKTVDMFHRAEMWLAHCKKGAGIYRGDSSYVMKHIVEKWIRNNYPGSEHYVANGAFIAAAIANGFEVEEVPDGTGLKGYLNMASMPSKWSGITTLCEPRFGYEIVGQDMVGLLADVVRGWGINRVAKRHPETSFFLVRHGLRRIQREANSRVRVSGNDWSVLLSVEGDHSDLRSLKPVNVLSAVLRGDREEFQQWVGGKFPYHYMPWAPQAKDADPGDWD